MPNRLFLFACYDRDSIIDDYVVHYVRALSELGDVIFFMDNDSPPQELQKIRSFTIHSQAKRHNAYDFGSYKRAYQWADNHGILRNYDFLYLCNDSCCGPFLPLKPVLENMESKGADWFGLASNTDSVSGMWHLQTWFVGMSPRIFLAEWYQLFIEHMSQENRKKFYVHKYEIFMSRMTQIFDASIYAHFDSVGHGIYRNPEKFLAKGMPFIKKTGYINSQSRKGLAGRYRALMMLEPGQRALMLNYFKRLDPIKAWLLVHHNTHMLAHYPIRWLKKAVAKMRNR